MSAVGVVTDREGVGRGQRDARIAARRGGPLEEAVEATAVELDEEALPAVVGIAVATALEVRRQREVGVHVAVGG